MAGELEPSSGDMSRRTDRVAVLDQHVGLLDPGSSILDNLRRLNPELTDNEAHAALARFAFRNRAALQLAGTLSGGERQMLAVGRALMARPKLLMLDEPSLGLAPLIVREIFRIIAELRRRGVSILLVEQNARAALQVADYAYVLETGEVAMEGPAHTLADDARVIEAYLGLGGKHQDKLAG
jgi:ABC-type branched-subunit amino acid transport system ATPase component